MRRLHVWIFCLIAVAAALIWWALATDQARQVWRYYKFRSFLADLQNVERIGGVEVPARDGVRLATDLYLPQDASGPRPAILVRLPYGRTRYWEVRHWIRLFAPEGYAVVVQDMRGRHGSGGRFAPWQDAATDGMKTLEWIAGQTWSNGKVGTIGCSALGESQIVLAAQRPAGLTAMVPIGAGGAIGSSGGMAQYFGVFDGGVPTLASLFGWFSRYGGQTADHMQGPAVIDYPSALAHLPLREAVSSVRSDPTGFEWFLDNFEDDDAMHAAGYISEADRFGTPALLVDEWYDPNVNATLRLAGQIAAGGTQTSTVIGPGRHCDFGRAFAESAVGDIPVDPDQARDMDAIYLAYMNHHLRGGAAPDLPPYTFYVMQENRWLSSAAWPPEAATPQHLFLGDGNLAATLPAERTQRAFVSDPLAPVPTIGGAICCTGNPDLRTGPLDQRPIEGRPDLLLYDGPVLERPMRIAGPLSARLWVRADVPDTDLVLRLTDVGPDGRSIPIQEGALRLRYRDGFDNPLLLQPGETVEARVTLRDIAYLLRPGHRLRLHIAGTSFPRLARNLNGGGTPALETEPHRATITVLGGADRPSRVEFYVLADP